MTGQEDLKIIASRNETLCERLLEHQRGSLKTIDSSRDRVASLERRFRSDDRVY